MRHEEDYVLGLVAFVDIFSERNEIVHIAYAVAAALDAVGACAVQCAHGVCRLIVAAVAVVRAGAAWGLREPGNSRLRRVSRLWTRRCATSSKARCPAYRPRR